MPLGVRWWEILLVLAAVLLLFGPKRLPEMGRSLGRGLREFKDSVTGKDDERDRALPPADDEVIEPVTPAASPRERDTVV